MPSPAPVLAPAERSYSGDPMRPERWASWVPRQGDILVCTPSKSGTIWTQTILAILVHGGSDLPARQPVLSPWIDADASLIDRVSAATAFGAMKAKAADYAPVGGTGYWESDAGFFHSAASNKWAGVLGEDELALYGDRFAALIPDAGARAWLEGGSGGSP